MPTAITLTIFGHAFPGELDDSPSARALVDRLPLALRLARWGDELSGNLGDTLGVAEAPDARVEMAVGELAYWPPGNAFCVYFGPTPASTGAEPRAASAVNPIGHLAGDLELLKAMPTGVEATLAAASSATPASRRGTESTSGR